jgi:type IV pilus assembly protein PilM
MFLTSKKKIVTGIHVGDDTVRVVQLVHQKDLPPVVSCSALSPVQGYFDAAERVRNTVQGIETCKNSIGRRFDRSNFNISCLSWPDIMVTTFNLPESEQEELEQSLLLEIEQVCPFDLSTSVIDYQLIENDAGEAVVTDGNYGGVMAVAPQHIIQEHYAILRKAGLKYTIIDADCMALLNCCNIMAAAPDTALLNIDMSHTIVAIPSDKGVPFVRNIDYGGKNIINSVVRAKGLQKEDFAGTLRSSQANLSTDLLNVLNKSCSSLTKSISRTLQFCVAENQDCRINEVLLTGELSLMPIIVEILNEQLDWPVRVWNPFENLETKNTIGHDLLDKTGSAFAIAAGLAAREPEYV